MSAATHVQLGNELAFPCMPPAGPKGGPAGGYPYPEMGLRKRELFAAMAMQGRLSSGMWESVAGVARDSVVFADALLQELSK